MSTSRIDDLRLVDPVLTAIAQGYENAAMIAERLFPTVTVSKMKGKIPVFGRDAFIVRETERAVRAKSNRIASGDFELVTFTTREQDIEAAIDYLEEEESPDYFKYEQRIAKDLADILRLGKEKQAADLAQDTANYAEGMTEEILQADAFNDYSGSGNSLTIIKDAMETVRNRVAKYPNTIVMGVATFNALINNPALAEMVKYSGLAKVTRDILREILNVEELIVGMSVYSEDGETFSDIWQDNIILAYVDKSPRGKRNEYNPSYGYTFQREGKPEIDTYYENGGKIKVIRNTDNYGMMITGKDAAFLIHNTNHESE